MHFYESARNILQWVTVKRLKGALVEVHVTTTNWQKITVIEYVTQ